MVDLVDGRPATTSFEVRERMPHATLVEAVPETGRTHQIRVHLSAIGHPILGDRAYGGGGDQALRVGLTRPFLHAWRLRFLHPVTGEEVVLEDPLPDDLADVLARVRRDQRPLSKLLAAMPTERDRLLVDIMASVGLRPGEALALSVGDFDRRKTLHIHTSTSGDTKTGEQRDVELPAKLAERLRVFLGSKQLAELMFPGSRGAMLTLDDWRKRVFDPATDALGLEVTPNALRHYAAAQAIGLGATVYSVQRMLGHAKPSITLDVYGRLWEQADRDLQVRLDRAYDERPEATEAVVVSLPKDS